MFTCIILVPYVPQNPNRFVFTRRHKFRPHLLLLITLKTIQCIDLICRESWEFCNKEKDPLEFEELLRSTLVGIEYMILAIDESGDLKESLVTVKHMYISIYRERDV